MTLTEAFLLKTNGITTSDDAATVLEFSGLNCNADWAPEDKSQRCKFYGCLIGYLIADNAGIASESEGGYSKTYNNNGKLSWIASLADESGCAELIEKYSMSSIVQNRSNMW